jgi:hypothetical protein
MAEVCTTQRASSTTNSRWTRREVAGALFAFRKPEDDLGSSRRRFASQQGIPKSTFQRWVGWADDIDAPQQTVAFFESPEGLELLHRIVTAAMVVITQMGPGGIRLVGSFLQLSGLDRFAASSYGVLHKAVTALETELVRFDQSERTRLGKLMRPRDITLCQDETFHPQPCLVAIEPASLFILLEQYVKHCDATSWDEALRKALSGLPLRVIQQTADEGAALASHAKNVGASHSPDLFHVQQELNRGTSFPMLSAIRGAEKTVDEAEDKVKRMEQIVELFNPSPQCPATFVEKQLEAVEAEHAAARGQLAFAKRQREQMSLAVRGLSCVDHPFDLVTGAERSAEEVREDLDWHFDTISELAQDAMLSERAHDKIAKARRVVAKMVLTITLVHLTIRGWVEGLSVSERTEVAILERLIPGRYLELVAGKAKGARRRKDLRARAATLLGSAEERAFLLSDVDEQDLALVEQVIEECAQLFQRSESCVEGRNSHLDLFHHGHHRLSERQLSAKTVIHNYLRRRPDGTTAAERFFGEKPRDLFEWLLSQLEPPPRPSCPRRRSLN